MIVILCPIEGTIQSCAHHTCGIATKEKDDSLDAIAVDDATADILQRGAVTRIAEKKVEMPC